MYVFESDPKSDDRRNGVLARREVSMLRTVGDSVLVDYQGREGTEICTLKPGEQVIVSPLLSPVLGMKIHNRDEGIASTIDIAPNSSTDNTKVVEYVWTNTTALSQIQIPFSND